MNSQGKSSVSHIVFKTDTKEVKDFAEPAKEV